MSVYRHRESKFYQYDFWLEGYRFYGSTGATSRRKAEKVESDEREKASASVALLKQSETGPPTLDLAADRYWTEWGQYQKNAKDIERDLAHCVDYIGPHKLLSDVTDNDIAKLVAWRRGHYRWDQKKYGFISPAQVNRSSSGIMRRIFTRAIRTWKMALPNQPNWKDHRLEEPSERVRELRHDEDEALTQVMLPDYEALRQFSLASGLRMTESLLTWPQVDFTNGVIVRTGKGGKLIYLPITPGMRQILLSRRGHHPVHVFTYAAQQARDGRRRGQRSPITRAGIKSHFRRSRRKANVTNYRWHDNRHTFGSNVLRGTGNLKLTQRAMNHARIETTSKYAHVLDEEVRAGMIKAEQDRDTKSRSFHRSQAIERRKK